MEVVTQVALHLAADLLRVARLRRIGLEVDRGERRQARDLDSHLDVDGIGSGSGTLLSCTWMCGRLLGPTIVAPLTVHVWVRAPGGPCRPTPRRAAGLPAPPR